MTAVRLPRVTVFGATGEHDLPGVARARALATLEFVNKDEALLALIPDTEILLGWDFRAGALETAWPRARALKWVHWAGAGVDAALFPALRDSDVVLTNARGVFDQPIAEYVLGLILCFAKDFPGTIRAQTRHVWDFRFTEPIRDSSALLIGVGSIGRAIGKLLHTAGMQVYGVGRNARSGDPLFGEVHALDKLDRLLDRADFVINVTPSTPETRGLFSAQRFQRMRPGARFINVGRGDAVDEAALAQALESGRLAGAALDVFAREPLAADSPLWDLENVIVSPHMSGDIRDAPERLMTQFTDNLRRFVSGEPLRNMVDKRRGY